MEECRIKLPGPVSKTTLAHLVIDYLKYILYYRGQFPLPLEQLKLLKESEVLKSSEHPEVDGHLIYCDDADLPVTRPVIPSTAKDRSQQKFYETISKFEEFFKELTRILETNNVMEIVLNLGPNMMNPKELYHIRMPSICTNEECTTHYASLQSCKVQFFRNVVNSDIWTDLKSDSLLPISVLLLLENGVTLNEHMEHKRFYALPKNCKQRTVHFIDKCSHLDDSSLQIEKYQCITVSNNNASSAIKTSGLWVKLKPDLKGFKSV